MSTYRALVFPPYRLDFEEQRLWRGDEEIVLKPKAFAILAYLATHPRRLIGKAELQTAVWDGAQVSPATVRSALRELRDALGDDPEARWIETVRGRGYRFVADADGAPPTPGPVDAPGPGPSLVGRGPSMHELRDWLTNAIAGRRHLGFVTGEPGIGKTSLVDAFLREIEDDGILFGRGQCIGDHGDREPYRPILEALTGLCRRPGGRGCLDPLRRHAPTWLVELPGLIEPAELRRLEASAFRVNQDRMLRELADALDAICAEQPVVLALEDLHWSDAATLDALELVARRTQPARLLMIGTHRPAASRDARGGTSRLAQVRAELHLHGLCTDLTLRALSRRDVAAYLEGRFPDAGDLDRWADFVFEKSEGNPLFMVSYTDEVARLGALGHTAGRSAVADPASLGVPHGLREMVEHQVDRLTEDERVALEGASVAGVDFDVEVVATALGELCPDPDATLGRVARERGLVRPKAGTRFRFAHALYREVLYERVPVLRKKYLHLAVGQALEALPASTAAAELAMHFERGGDLERCVQHGLQAADAAIQRSAHREAAEVLRSARGALDRLPGDDGRAGLEVELLAKLANCLSITKGYTDPEVGETFRLAYERSSSLDAHSPEIMTALAGLCGFHVLRAEHGIAREIGQRQMELARRSGDPFDLVAASVCLSASLFSTGCYEESIRHLEAGIEAYDPALHRPGLTPQPNDQGVQAMAQLAMILATVGRIDDARSRSTQATSLARDLDHVPSVALAHFYSMVVYHGLGESDEASRIAAECLQLSMENGFPYYIPAAMIISGSTEVRRGNASAGLDSIEQGVALFRGVGARLGVPHYLALLGEARGEAGDVNGGLDCVREGLEMVEQTGEVSGEAELYFAEGHLRALHDEPEEDLATSFRNGVESARRWGGPATGLRPAIRLARLWRDTGRTTDARQLLTATCTGFTDSHDTPILREAKGLLAELA